MRTRKPVAQPPPAVTAAKPAPASYRRNLPHLQQEGTTLYVTFCTFRRWVLPEPARTLVLEHCLRDHGVKLRVHGAVVMADHVHMVFTQLPDEQGNMFGLAQILGGIKGASAHRVNQALRRRGHIWQDESFDHILRCDENVQQKVEYICQNPVRKGLVQSADDYPWLWRGQDVAQPPPAVTNGPPSAVPGAVRPDPQATAEGRCATQEKDVAQPPPAVTSEPPAVTDKCRDTR
jgi:REP element-mobilizing transposase RayT